MYKFNVEKTKDDIIKWIRDWFEKNGRECNAVVGISGGKDSSIVAAICVKALGKDRVIGVLMPNHKQTDIEYAQVLCKFLGIKNYTIDVGPAIDNVLNNIQSIATDIEISEQTKMNLPARIRMATLYAVSQSVNGRVANTCNLSETLLSWETRWGDAVGDFSPLSDLTVEEVKAVGYAIGLPKELIEKIPSDGLCGTSDEEAMGIPYAVMDKYTRTGKIDDENIKKKIDERVDMYRFKRKSIPYFETGLKKYIF